MEPEISGRAVPMCHFKPMTLHGCDSDDSGRSDGYQCDHCGHTESLDTAWARVERLEKSREDRKRKKWKLAK